jgi:DNA repair protein RecO (recombination protein O)
MLERVRPHRTEAIILHTFAARERDKLVVFLTPDHGKRKGWAYGARSMRTRFGASLEPLAKVKIGYVERESDEIVRIESIDLIRSLFPAQQNLAASLAATYIAETVDTFAQASDPSELIYRLLDRSSEALLGGVRPLAVVAYAEIWMLRLTGILPSIKTCHECDEPLGRPLRFSERVAGFVCERHGGTIVSNEAATALESILKLPIAEFDASAEVLFELRTIAATIRRHFLGHELKSFEVLSTLM